MSEQQNVLPESITNNELGRLLLLIAFGLGRHSLEDGGKVEQQINDRLNGLVEQ